jgi:hypothetical protein
VERRISGGDSDDADGAEFESSEPTAGERTKDGTSEELGGGEESITGSR